MMITVDELAKKLTELSAEGHGDKEAVVFIRGHWDISEARFDQVEEVVEIVAD